MCVVHLGAHHSREGRGRVTDDIQMCRATLLTLVHSPALVVDQDLLIEQIRTLREKGKRCDSDSPLSLKGGYLLCAKTTGASVWPRPPITLCDSITVRVSKEEACETRFGICKVSKDVENVSDKANALHR